MAGDRWVRLIGCAGLTATGKIGRMDNQMMVSLVGAGSALAGALIGGAAAVAGAVKAARTAYLGPLHLARRTAQEAAHAGLLTAANDYEIATEEVLDLAYELVQDSIYDAEGRQRDLGSAALQEYRHRISMAGSPARVMAAARHVSLQGPPHVHEAADAVQRAAFALEDSLTDLETIYRDEQGGICPAVPPDLPRQSHVQLRTAIGKFADVASEYLNKS
ncbi:hypothetical protein ACFRFL_14170 [Streptomyces sp. NPDC056708]|uniref:hypothetical protein n=1 Tax=unclassified Streptomyces TaxID=2593676 RepID=UPI003691CC24